MASLKVGIVGGGIAGYAAAIALSRAGHEATVFEKSPEHNEIGAAIAIPPHGGRILRGWGLDAIEAGGTILLRDGSLYPGMDRVQLKQDISDAEKRYGAPFVSYHRGDLHSALRREAGRSGAQTQLSARVVDVEATGSVTLASGEQHTFDLVIIADGVYSSFVWKVSGSDFASRKSGRSVYRTLVSTNKVLCQHPSTEILELRKSSTIVGGLNPKAGNGVLLYPCRNGTMLNMIVHHPSVAYPDEADPWNRPALIGDAATILEQSHEAFGLVLSAAEEIREYDMAYRDPLPTYINGRLLMIGDAAHPMLPMHAAGATTALEDAAALEVFLTDLPDGDDLFDRLQLWQALRMPRDSTIQILSNTVFKREGFSTRPIESAVREFYSGPLPEVVAPGWSRATSDFLFSYDAFKQARQALKWSEETADWKEVLSKEKCIPGTVVQHFGTVRDPGT